MMVSSFVMPRRTWRTLICLLGSDGSLQSAHLSLGISLLRTKRNRQRMPPSFCQNELNGLMMCFSTGGGGGGVDRVCPPRFFSAGCPAGWGAG